MTDARDDRALITEARAGSASAFVALVRRHQQPLRSFLRRVCYDFVEADDIAQETLTTAWARLDTYRGDSSFRSWLCGMAFRKAADAGRSDRRRRMREAQAELIAEAADGGTADDRLDLDRAFATLSREQRAAVALCWAEGCSNAEAAEILNIPVGTVKSLLARARLRLRLSLGESDDLE
jgi:RNA polymerase sigma-70 factor (ECF subfamily)